MNKIKWLRIVLMFALCTIVAIAFFSMHMGAIGKLVNPPTVSGMFFTLMILAVPGHLIEFFIIYTLYYFITIYVCNRLNRFRVVVFMVLFGFVYFYVIQAFLGGIVGDVDEYSFIKSFAKTNYLYFYLTLIYMVQIDFFYLKMRRNQLLAIGNTKHMN